MLSTARRPKKAAAPAAAAPQQDDAAAAAAAQQQQDDVEHHPDVVALRASLAGAMKKAFELLLHDGTYEEGGAKLVATQIYNTVLRKMLERALESKQRLEEMMDKYSDIAAFLAECDRLGVVAETAQFPSVRGPELARRLGHVHVSCVPRETETRATTLFEEVRKTLERLCDEPGDNAARGYLVLLAPDIWTDKELDIVEQGIPPPRVRAQGMGKRLVRKGTMKPTELPGGIMLEVTETEVRLKIQGKGNSKQKAKSTMYFALSAEKTRLIFEQVARVSSADGRAASLMIDVLVTNDAFVLLVFLAVFVTAAPLGLVWDDAAHATDDSDPKNQFVTFASLALHCTTGQVYSVIDNVHELAPKLICGDMIKSDIFESASNMAGMQLALSTVAFYLAIQQVSTYFRDIAGNTPYSQRLMPLALLSKLPINAMDVFGTANEPTDLLPHPDFKAMGPGVVTMFDMVLFAFATKEDCPAVMVFAVRRMVPWPCHELMIPRNIDPRIVIGMTEEIFVKDLPLAVAALSANFAMLCMPAYFRNKPTDDSPIRDLIAAHRADPNGLFDGTSCYFQQVCKHPVTIDGLFFPLHAAANFELCAEDDRASAFSAASFRDFVDKYVDDNGNLVRIAWEEGGKPAASKKRKRTADNDDDDDDDGRMTVKTSKTSGARKRKRNDDDDDDDGRMTVKTAKTSRTSAPAVKKKKAAPAPPPVVSESDSDDDEDEEVTPEEKMMQKMIEKTLAKMMKKKN